MEKVTSGIARVFSACQIDVRQQLFQHHGVAAHEFVDMLEKARIWNLKQPFDKQQKMNDGTVPLYDGFVLQRSLEPLIPHSEDNTDHVHILLTDLLTCTFSEDDWRYHGRAVICGTPAIISTKGIIEAPAKPKEFYYPSGLGAEHQVSMKTRLRERFIDYGDKRLTEAATGYALQALFFFVTNGEPFCFDRNCRLFNAHWQEDLIRTQVENPALCSNHQRLIDKFNIEVART
ncbi:MAG: hypothetical protein MN733_21060 [Nitrososphaera sp.]|nr:hypothetical protein [Nitrososphaera sp.]